MGEGGPLSAAHSRATQNSSVGRAHVWVLHTRTPGQAVQGGCQPGVEGHLPPEHVQEQL